MNPDDVEVWRGDVERYPDDIDVDEEVWRFWQPFQGGRVFVATQVGPLHISVGAHGHRMALCSFPPIPLPPSSDRKRKLLSFPPR